MSENLRRSKSGGRSRRERAEVYKKMSEKEKEINIVENPLSKNKEGATKRIRRENETRKQSTRSGERVHSNGGENRVERRMENEIEREGGKKRKGYKEGGDKRREKGSSYGREGGRRKEMGNGRGRENYRGGRGNYRGGRGHYRGGREVKGTSSHGTINYIQCQNVYC
ncbi:nucleolin-like [Leptopilina heterotoma]|uniref:nucleolin-like n=1 Tax=Leptopilina heterotoma TaxID=63436 RepID=UPI001CA9268F|nr:nucleolin-like [Leptopilina heterotoma]